jgi:flagellar basal-body rod modification protein FlgD
MSDIDTNIYTQLGLNKTRENEQKTPDELGQDDFLELMTAQLKFQDPLEPMENGDFLAQMAQFSTVSGINDLNDAFNSMSTAFQSNQALQASTMVGRDVLIPGDRSRLGENDPMVAAVELDQPARQVVVNITDANGQLVQRLDYGLQPAGMMEVRWDGQMADGSRAAPGLYTVSAEVHQGDGISSGTMFTQARVESVTLGQAGQDLTLTVSDLGDIPMSQIRKIS